MRNAVVVSDTHFGCRLGLCTGTVQLDDGGTYEPSLLQRKVASMWDEFWTSWVPQVTKGEPYVVIHNGDIVDGVHHDSVTQISHNLLDQSRLAKKVMGEVLTLPRVAGYYHVRGTEAHVGKSASLEEGIAQSLGAIPNQEGQHARWELWLRMEHAKGPLIHFCHHIGTTSSAAYESTAVHKELVEAYNESGRWGEEPPDCVVRSHRHRHYEIRIATSKGYGISTVTPGWQLKTPFVWRGTLGRTGTPQIGGILIRCGDEDPLYTRFKIWKIDRPRDELIP